MSSKSRSISPFWLLALIPIVLLALGLYQLIGPSPAIMLSPANTKITGPLGPGGLPDYVRYLHEKAMDGLTADNNAAVLYWTAMWPGELSPESYHLICDALGMDVFPDETAALVPWHHASISEQIVADLRAQLPQPEENEQLPAEDGDVEDGDVDDDEGLFSPQDDQEPPTQQAKGLEHWRVTIGGRKDLEQVANRITGATTTRPWTSEQIPTMGKWVRDNQQPLDLLVEGSQRPRYYSPSPSVLNGSRSGMVMMLLPGAQGLREAARGLTTRAMWHTGEGRPMQAWKDIRACYGVARHACQGHTLVQHLIGVAVESMANSSLQALLHHGNLSLQQAETIFMELSKLPPLPTMVGALDQGERFMYLDTALRISSGAFDYQSIMGVGDGPANFAGLVMSTKIDWNLVLADGNKWYDRFIAAADLPSREERVAALNVLDEDIAKLMVERSILGGIVSSRRRSQLVSEMMTQLLLPAIGPTVRASDRAAAEFALTRTAAALAVYRAKHGAYPEQLDDLLPDVEPSLFSDIYSGQPFIYAKKPDGYLLYSIYENGVDDGGNGLGGQIVGGEWVNERANHRSEELDHVIRMPDTSFVSD